MKGKAITKKLFQGDVSVWIIFMLLCCFSLVEVFSATSTLAYKNANIWMPIARHASFLLAGFLLILALTHTPYKYFSLAILLLPISVLMLIVTPIIGISTNDASRWLEIFGIQFQPSEFGKLACIVYVAFLLSKREKLSDEKVYKYILIGVGCVCIPILPFNFSTAFLLGSVCFLMMFIGQIPLKKLGKLLFSFSVCVTMAFLILSVIPHDITKKYIPRAETWQNRILKYFGPKTSSTDDEITNNTYVISDDNYQVTHAKIAIARGGVFGKLPGQSVQRDFLPQAYSDFIYAIIIEELGVVGGVVVLLLYLMLMIRVGIIARRCEKLFPKYLVLGCGLLIVIQALTNMAVAVNLIPVTGQPLPLISRGGTSTMLTCVYIGIILSISHFGAKMSDEEEVVDENSEMTEEANNEENSEENPIFAIKTIEADK